MARKSGDGRSLFFVVVLHEQDKSGACEATVVVFFSSHECCCHTSHPSIHISSLLAVLTRPSLPLLHRSLPSTENHSNETYPKAEIFPSVACKFENVSFQCPPGGKAILDRDYAGWATDCDSGNHNHRTESGRAGQEKVVCTGLDPAVAKLLTKPRLQTLLTKAIAKP